MRALLGAALVAASISSAALIADAFYTAATANPANTIATTVGFWFGANATGTTICIGQNVVLTCPFGTLTKSGTVTATVRLQVKDLARTYTVTVVNGTGPAPLTSVLTATFASNAAATVTLAAGATDTLNLDLKLKGSTPKGTYTGAVLITDAMSG
ncbi:MAG TPA: hypothetical protein VGQ86_02790, partial [Candidatus Limnocylindria bacterium]|nr:hypothetical protein [Candidatus Limnocylindria bacterium]